MTIDVTVTKILNNTICDISILHGSNITSIVQTVEMALIELRIIYCYINNIIHKIQAFHCKMVCCIIRYGQCGFIIYDCITVTICVCPCTSTTNGDGLCDVDRVEDAWR